MAEITINGVKYTNVPNKKAGTKFAASLTQSNIGASQAVQDYVNSAYFYPLVNAIDINWNGVEVDENSYINSTSDLITYIATKGSNVDLTSYATKNYVDQKIEDVIGGAPETLDTLKELADALADDASLAYVTQALDGKADKSSLTNYATNSYVTVELDKKADKSQLPDMNNYSTVSYVTTELDKKANKSEIPSMPDLTPYATTSYVTNELDKKADKSSLTNYATNSYVTIELDKKANKTDIPVVPDMSNYVTMTAYNMLVQKVDELAYLISYYHPSQPVQQFEGYWTYNGMRTDNITVSPSDPNMTLSFVSNPTIASGIGTWNFYDMPSSGVTINTSTGEMTITPSLLSEGSVYSSVGYMYQNNGESTSFYITITVTSSTPTKKDPWPEWTANGMTYYNSISVNPSQGLTTLTFSGYPASGWTFSNPAVTGITVDTSTGSITVDPAYASAGTYYVTASYPGDATYNSFSKMFSITVESGKQSATGNWYDSNNVMTSNKAVIAGDTTTYTFTFQSTPASGWSFGNPMMTGITVDQSNGTITIDPSGMPDSAYPINITASYTEDSSYWGSMASFSIKVLPAGANPDFYYENSSINLSNTMPSQSPMLRNSLTYDHIDYHSDNTSVATVNSYGTIEYVGPGTCTVSATAFDSNNLEMAQSFITVYCTQSKQSANGYWYDSNNVMTSNKAVVSGDTTTYTFTFQSTPASGWTFSNPMLDGLGVDQSNGTITIYPTILGNSSGITNSIYISANYTEDASYYMGHASFNIRVLPEGSNPDFYYEQNSINLSNTMPSQSPMIHNSLTYDHIGYLSSDSNVATVNSYGTIEYVGPGTCTVTATAYDSSNNALATATISVTCTQSKQMTSFQWYDSNNNTVQHYAVNLGGSGTDVFHYDATPADGWTINGGDGTSIVLDTALKTLTVDKSKLSIRGNNVIVAQRAEDSSYYSGTTVLNVTVIPADESTFFYFTSQGISMSPSFSSMSLMVFNNTGIDTIQYPINYSSSDTSVATVDNYGTVQYVAAGNAIVTATLSDGNNSYTATATVDCNSN